MKNIQNNKHKHVLFIYCTQGVTWLSLAVVYGLFLILKIITRPLFNLSHQEGSTSRARALNLFGDFFAVVNSSIEHRTSSTSRARLSSLFGALTSLFSNTIERLVSSTSRARALSLLGVQQNQGLHADSTSRARALNRLGVFNKLGLRTSSTSRARALSLFGVLVLVSVSLPLLPPISNLLSPITPKASAATSNQLNFQGRLLTNTGSLVPDGDYNIEFNLYYVPTAGSSQWTETRLVSGTGVTVKNGYFSVYLGDQTAFPALDWSQDLYLGMTIRGTTSCVWGSCTPADLEMTPRFKLTSVPYAFRAANVASSDTNAVSTNSDGVDISTGDALGVTSNSGNITIDTGTATGTTGTIILGSTNASALTIGRSGITTTLQGSVALNGAGTALAVTNNATIGGTLGVTGVTTATGGLTVGTGSNFINQGSSLFTALAITDKPSGGDIGTAVATVDIATTFNVNQTTASQALTLPNPSVATAGRIVYVNNVGSVNFSMYGSAIAAGKTGSFIWNGTSWVQTISFASTGTDTIGAIDGGTYSVNGASISGTTIYLQTASGSQVGLVNVAAQNFAGVKTFNNGAVIAAGQSLTVSGGNSASRPGSPTEGMVYFDTTTDSLLTYANGKWQSDRGEFVVVAANDSTQAEKDSADYVADGNTGAAADGDQVQINAALTEAAGGKVILLAGTYVADATILIPNNTTLAGTGQGTLIELADIDATDNLIENSDTTTGTGVVVRDLKLDGRDDLNTAGVQSGIYLSSVGNVSTNRPGGTIYNINSANFRSYGIETLTSANISITNNTVTGNNQGIRIITTTDSVINANKVNNNSTYGIILYTTSNNNTLTSNTLYGNGNSGITIGDSSNNTVTANTINNGQRGIFIQDSSFYNTITSNTSNNNLDHGIEINASSNNIISSNTLHNNTGSGGSSGVFLVSSDNNQIIANKITDTAGIGYAINISDSGSDNNYLSSNNYSGTGAESISDTGTNTHYASQQVAGNTLQSGSSLLKANATIELTGDIDPAASTTVTGTSTKFTTELQVGDRITVTGETRTVTAIASDTSLTVDTAFSNNANDTTPDRLPASLLVQNSAGVNQLVIADNGNLTVTSLTTLNGGLTIEATDTFTFNTDAFTDFTGGGLINSSGVLTVDTAGGTGFIQLAPGTVQTNSTGVGAIRINNTSGGNFVQFQNSGTDVLTIQGSGIFDLSPTADNDQLFIVRNAGTAEVFTVDTNESTGGAIRVNGGNGGTTARVDIYGTASANSLIGLRVNNGVSTGNIVEFQDNGTSVLTVADGGAVTLTQTLAVGTLGTADTSSYLCRNSSNIISGCLVSPISSSLADNVTDAFDLQEGANNYININTTDTTENISFGNVTTNPSYNFLGSGTLSVAGPTTVSGLLTGSLGATISGADINLNVSSNFATNINTGTSTGAVNIASGSGANAVAIGNSASTTTVLGITNINTSGTAATSIGNSGAVTTLTGSSILLNTATLSRTASGTTALDLVDGANTTLALQNSGAGVANLTVDGSITAVGVNAGAGLLQGQLGLTVTGNTSLSTTAGNTTSIGNATGLLALTGSAGNLFIFNGVTIDDTELNRLDGKDAALVDTNDAVNTAITGTGALATGSIASGFGTITTGNTITGTTLNGTTGINTGAGAGTQRIDSSGNLVNIGTISSGLINGQTINATANFTGTLAVTGATTLSGGLTVNNATATDDQIITSITTGGASRFNGTITNADLTVARTYTLPDQSGTFLLGAAGTGNALVQVPTSNSANALGANVISPTAASIVGLTVNGTTSTAATALSVVQTGAATGLTVASSSTGNAQNITLTNAAGTQTAGLSIDRTTAGGTTSSLLSLSQTAGTATNGILFTGTIGTDITTAATRTLNITTGTTGALTLDSGTTGQINIGTNANSKTIQIGAGAATAATSTVNIANSTGALQAVTIGSNANFASTLALRGGNGATAITLTPQTTGQIVVGAAAGTGQITVGSSSAGQTIAIANGTGAPTVNIANTSVSGATVSIAGAANTTANVISIANGASAANSTVNILSGVGTAGAGTLNLGNNTRVTSIALGNINPAAARTISLGNTTATGNAVVDTINIATNPTTIAGGNTVNIASGTPTGAGTNLVTIGSTVNTSTLALRGGSGSTAITLTTGAGTGLVNVLTGNLQVGNGVPTVALNGEDAYIEGTLEVDGAVQFDTTLLVTGLTTLNGGLTIEAGDTLTFNGQGFTNFLTGGLVNTGGVLSVDTTSASGFFRNGGNSFSGAATLGTNDNNSLIFRTNSTTALTINNVQAATFAGTLAVQGATVTVGTASTTSGGITFLNATNPFGVTVSAANQTIGNATISFPNTSGVSDTFCLVTLNNCAGANLAVLVDNIPDALDIQEGTNNYININTTNSSENISFGNATTNPSYNFLGSGALALGGNLSVTGTTTISATGGNTLAVTGAPINTGNTSLLRLGNAISGGSISSNGGTYFGINSPGSGAGSNADFLSFQSNGTLRLRVRPGGGIAAVAIGDTAETGSYFLFGATSITTIARTSTNIVQINQGAASQTADLLQFQNNSTTVLSGINASGNYYYRNSTFNNVLSTATLTASRSIVLPDASGTVLLSSTGYLQGGNSFTATAVLGTNDNFDLQFETFGTTKLTLTTGGDLQLAEGTSRTLSVQTRTTNVAGNNLTVSAGAAGTGGSAFVGGVLTLSGGAAGGTGNANGGGVLLTGGTGTGTGVLGLVTLAPTVFQAAAVQNFTGSANITQANIDTYSTVLISSNAAGYTATLTDPTTSTIGRVIYVTNTGSYDMALSANTVGVALSVTLKPASTATMIWNGVDWTAAGASSSTDLQAAYNNTATSAGGAELVLNASGGAADGLTIRNNATTAIVGGLLEVQTSIGSNLFSVNNNATEFATNGGAETAGASSSTFPASTWDATTGGTVTRYTTPGTNIATGQASVSVVTGATIDHGARNRISTSLTSGLTYTVSFAIRGATNFNTLDVLYSPDGTTSGTTACATGKTVTSGIWTRITCSFVAGGSITSSNSILIRQTDAVARTFYIDNLSININASATYAADGSVDSALGTNWTSFGTVSSITRDTSVIYDTGGSVTATTNATANTGIRNNLAIVPQTNTQYLVTFYARSATTVTDTLAVGFLPAGGTGVPTGTAACVDYSTQSLVANTWTKITCLFTTTATAITDADLVIYQTDATARTIYIDALTISLNTNNSSNVQIGGGNKGGPTTLLTLDRSAGPPVAANNDAYLGSMYYDTSTGRIQCYEAGGWGTCGSPPDNIVNLNPEYAGSVLNGTGIGTMQADVCANEVGVLQVNSTLCSTGQALNYYRWTSPQATQQTYSIYVTYQLPSTFDGFSSDDTVQLTGRVSNTTNAAVTYEMFRSQSGALTKCGTGETTVATVANTWQTVGINGNEATGCGFNSSSANAFVLFKINVKANSNANAYVSTLTFTTTGR